MKIAFGDIDSDLYIATGLDSGDFSMKTSDIIVGIFLIILGILFLADNFGYVEFDIGEIWPLLLVIGGAGFWVGFFQNRKNHGLLMPGTILIIFGLIFWYSANNGWYQMEYLWPGFMIGPGLGFFMMYFFGEREKALLIPAGILTGMGLIFFFSFTGMAEYWPVLLILGGLYLIYKHYSRRDSESNDSRRST
jgi:hypothetical protein